MSFLETYRREVSRIRDEIARLQKDKAGHTSKLVGIRNKINSATQAAHKASSASTYQSKMREIGRLNSDYGREEQKVANLDERIARKQKDLNTASEKLTREERKESEQRAKREQEDLKKRDMQLKRIASQMNSHSVMYNEAKSMLESIKNLPDKIKIVFFATNPMDQMQLRLDEEVRSITEMIRKSDHRDSVELRSCWATRTEDILQAINEHDPTIIHFSGHGSSNDKLVFQDDSGRTKLVSKEAIVQVMASIGTIRLVFFNTCYSSVHAKSVVEFVDAAIGMNDTIGDKAARVFASQFYSAIGFGHSVLTAFKQAKASLMLSNIPEEDIPELYLKEGLNADDLIIVRPVEN